MTIEEFDGHYVSVTQVVASMTTLAVAAAGLQKFGAMYTESLLV